jgi:mono/diheme cytochrome c family protein
MNIFRAVGTCVVLALSVPVLAIGPPQEEASTLTGDEDRGRPLYNETYRCYACHGFAGETGNPRLNPMRLDQAAFLNVVQAGRRNGQMPGYDEAPVQDLADVYAYIQSLPSDAPPADSIPLLEGILRDLEDVD